MAENRTFLATDCDLFLGASVCLNMTPFQIYRVESGHPRVADTVFQLKK